MSNTEIIINAEGLKKYYQRGKEIVRALDGIDMTIRHGEMVAITGPSGSGKTTLLSLLGGLTLPSEGSLIIAGTDVGRGNEKGLASFRRNTIGFVFQQFYLIPTLTVAENVLLPTLFSGKKVMEIKAREILSIVGLSNRERHLPSELSGGEMQRAAIARALINSPHILLTDEPTGSLDTQTGKDIIKLFMELNREGLTVIVVTHNLEIASLCGQAIRLKDGRRENEIFIRG
ncbi:MAG: ABC transporter ATP-binding protein [Nitrospinae bacterium]|nr:ABC transporter ATP-binding protein [Nitrospinota bacterium]MBI3814948.1 ABC transporter ATP-binding protein [Nitrospinota bacterium]